MIAFAAVLLRRRLFPCLRTRVLDIQFSCRPPRKRENSKLNKPEAWGWFGMYLVGKKWLMNSSADAAPTWPATENSCNRRQRTRVHTVLFIPFRFLFPNPPSSPFLFFLFPTLKSKCTQRLYHLITLCAPRCCYIRVETHYRRWPGTNQTRRRKSSCLTRAGEHRQNYGYSCWWCQCGSGS